MTALAHSLRLIWVEMVELARRAAPTVVIVALQIFR